MQSIVQLLRLRFLFYCSEPLRECFPGCTCHYSFCHTLLSVFAVDYTLTECKLTHSCTFFIDSVMIHLILCCIFQSCLRPHMFWVMIFCGSASQGFGTSKQAEGSSWCQRSVGQRGRSGADLSFLCRLCCLIFASI